MDLRWYQKEAVDAAYGYLCSQPGNPVICLPTGSGKSIVIAELVRRAVQEYSGRVLILQHRKELIQQNAEKVRSLIQIPVGEYSAGLRRFATDHDVVLCGIQSVYAKATLFDRRHLVIVDEVHLVPSSGEGMYSTFLSDMRTINPDLRVVGLTATPFRTGEGPICRPDGVFQNICYEASVKRLIQEGYLCQVTNRPNDTQFDTSGLHVRYGEFVAKELESLFVGSQVSEAVKEIIAKTADRHSIMVFCTTVRHAASVACAIEQLTGERVAMVEGNTLPLERAAILSDFRSMRVRWLVNVDVLTTGFDAQCVDAICILRATASPGLFAQIVGRGLRTHPSKSDCLVLDFGSNIERHGSIDAIDYGRQRDRKSGSKAESDRICPNCTQSIPKDERVCECGFEFPHREPNHDTRADLEAEIISTSEPETYTVSGASCTRHEKEGKLPSLRITYSLEEANMPFGLSEWICIEHEGFARKKAEEWWRQHSSEPCPVLIDEAIDLFRRGWVAIPRLVTARREGKYWRVVAREIDEIPVGVSVDEFEQQSNEEVPF
jgi:DNA repair protein RadD